MDSWETLLPKLQRIENLECNHFDDQKSRLRFWIEPDGSGAIFLDMGGDRGGLWVRCQWGSINQMIPAIDWYVHHIEYVTGSRSDAPEKNKCRNFGGRFGRNLVPSLEDRQ